MTNAKDTLNEYNEIKSEGRQKLQSIFEEKDKKRNAIRELFGDDQKRMKEETMVMKNKLNTTWKEENSDLVIKYQELYKQRKLHEESFQKGFEELKKLNPELKEDTFRNVIFGTTASQEQKENFNESLYQERASHKHDKISDGDFELLKSLTARYSSRMQSDVKMHKFDSKPFYIPDYNKVDLRYSDMDYQENGKKNNKKRAFENLKNSPKMQKLAQENNLDISTINFQESLATFLHLGQAVADAYGMGIKFDIDFIENNKEQVKRILKGIYTITGQIVIMPYKINEKGGVSSCDVRSDGSGLYSDDGSNDYYYNLSSFIACRS